MRRTVCLAVTALTLQVDEKDSPGMQRVLRNRLTSLAAVTYPRP